jgi:hypothetical protein
MKPVMQKQRSINLALKATFQRELGNFLRARSIFSVHPAWVPDWVPASNTTDHVRTCIHFRTFSQAIMRNPFLPLNMEVFLQQVVESQLRPLLDSFLVCKKIKVKGADAHKTTFITDCGTVSYKCLPSGLSDASPTFKRPIHTTLDELINIHIYLDDLIICVKRMIITSEFQVLIPGPFGITFVLDTNSCILRYLLKQFFSYNTNGSRLKH